jgi:hypothetical protein
MRGANAPNLPSFRHIFNEYFSREYPQIVRVRAAVGSRGSTDLRWACSSSSPCANCWLSDSVKGGSGNYPGQYGAYGIVGYSHGEVKQVRAPVVIPCRGSFWLCLQGDLRFRATRKPTRSAAGWARAAVWGSTAGWGSATGSPVTWTNVLWRILQCLRPALIVGYVSLICIPVQVAGSALCPYCIKRRI